MEKTAKKMNVLIGAQVKTAKERWVEKAKKASSSITPPKKKKKRASASSSRRFRRTVDYTSSEAGSDDDEYVPSPRTRSSRRRPCVRNQSAAPSSRIVYSPTPTVWSPSSPPKRIKVYSSSHTDGALTHVLCSHLSLRSRRRISPTFNTLHPRHPSKSNTCPS